MLLGLVFLFLFVSPALSLKCYVCSSTTTNEECNSGTQECQAPLDTCMTIIDVFGSSKAIVKQCASRATCSGAASTASVDSNGNGNTINCCRGSNYCNFNGADSVGVHSTLLLLTAAVSLLLSR
ncbi:ly6/PLAUR domain-containing protein 6-like [Mugil cephalus]|uniref:ly6/PLAUR domain-containing protein 6-like n=1 Tax=Mugil cephalus TaxID=48193 RepID=UPI001FB68777|nr:ly6/PLAUR domain-containing protein 6-like [Mugil cephalus]